MNAAAARSSLLPLFLLLCFYRWSAARFVTTITSEQHLIVERQQITRPQAGSARCVCAHPSHALRILIIGAEVVCHGDLPACVCMGASGSHVRVYVYAGGHLHLLFVRLIIMINNNLILGTRFCSHAWWN